MIVQVSGTETNEMLSKLFGEILEIYQDALEIKCGSLAFYVYVAKPHRFKVRQEVTLHTVLVFREDAQSLYGFIDQKELNLFKLITKVHSIGPKLAMQILSHNEQNFIHACLEGSKDKLCQISGIGPKTALRILAEIDKDQLRLLDSPSNSAFKEARQILMQLGFTHDKVDPILSNLIPTKLSLDQLIKSSLQQLGELHGKSY